MTELIKWLFIGISIGISPIFIFLVIAFLHPEKVEAWWAILCKVVLFFVSGVPKLKRGWDRRAVASSIQDAVNCACDRINKKSPGVLPHAIKIEWVRTEEPEAFIRGGKGIVRLKHFVNQDRNIVDSTLLYLKVGLLPRSKNYLDKTLRRSCEFKVATQVFQGKRDSGAWDYFCNHYLDPAILEDSSLQRDIQLLDDLDFAGFFTHVFLTEVNQAGQKLLGAVPSRPMQEELRNFAKFLQRIALKGQEEDVPLAFEGVKVKAGIILVARSETIEQYGIRPYINRLYRCVNEGYDSIYIQGWGDKFIKEVLGIKKKVQGKAVTLLRSYANYPVKDGIRAILLVCQSNSSYLARRRELQEEVKEAMNYTVPEVKNGDIEIAAIARKKGVGCKVAVRPASQGDVFDAVEACIGKDGERFNALKERIPNEFVAIVPWSHDIREFIVNSLTPLRRRYVDSVQIDEENLIAEVTVTDARSLDKALGKSHNNIRLARELTGWIINIKGAKRPAIVMSPEEELREIIKNHVPEIQNGEVEIIALARIEGVGSKVLVKWRGHGRGVMASQVCRGNYGERLRRIKEEIIGEWLYFHEWCEDTSDLIVGCLYPLEKSDVESIDLDHEKRSAMIFVKSEQQSSPVWRSRYNMSLAEKVSGWSIYIKE